MTLWEGLQAGIDPWGGKGGKRRLFFGEVSYQPPAPRPKARHRPYQAPTAPGQVSRVADGVSGIAGRAEERRWSWGCDAPLGWWCNISASGGTIGLRLASGIAAAARSGQR